MTADRNTRLNWFRYATSSIVKSNEFTTRRDHPTGVFGLSHSHQLLRCPHAQHFGDVQLSVYTLRSNGCASMRTYTRVLMLLAGFLCRVAFTQTTPEAIPNGDPGVARATLLDNAQVRILRVEVQPGGVRRIHTHDDVRFHLFLPIAGAFEITIGSAKPVKAAVGQAFYLEKGTTHGFRNTGDSVAMALEVFVKPGASLAETDARELATILADTHPGSH